MNTIRSILRPKPEYVFRPSQIIRRLIREYRPSRNEFEEVMLPWGLRIRLRPLDSEGSWIWRLGIKELPVSETIYRLMDPGELAIDVGANIGHMTSLMAARTGPRGKVLSFEPHPLTFAELNTNVLRWAQRPRLGEIQIHRVALGEAVESGSLEVPGDDSVNRVLASLVKGDAGSGSTFPVQIRRLDEFVAASDSIGVMKVDVEGHEYHVLMGAEPILRRHRIRDIIFEESKPNPIQAGAFLQSMDYSVFALSLTLWGPVLRSIGDARTPEGYIPTYLATTDPERALNRLRNRGWLALRSRC